MDMDSRDGRDEQLAEHLYLSLQNISASSSNALHRAVSVLGPLHMRSSASRYDMQHRSGSLSAIRRRRAKVRQVRSPSFTELQADTPPIAVCTHSSSWSLTNHGNGSGGSGNDGSGSRVVNGKRRHSLFSPPGAQLEHQTAVNGLAGSDRSLWTVRSRGLSDSVFSLRSLGQAATIPGYSRRLQRSNTFREGSGVLRSDTQQLLQQQGVRRHRDLSKSQSLPFHEPTIRGCVRAASRQPAYQPFPNGHRHAMDAAESPEQSASPGLMIWDQVIAKHWHSLVAYLKPHQCQDLLYQYDLITWQQYRDIESSKDDQDASSHLLYALRSGAPDAVGTFIDLLAQVPGQENLAHMLRQELVSLSRETIDGAVEEARTFVSPQHQHQAVAGDIHRSSSQPWSMLTGSPTGAQPPSSPPSTAVCAASPPPTSTNTTTTATSASQAKADREIRVGHDLYSMVSKPPKSQQPASGTPSSAQVTSDEGFVEQTSDDEHAPPVPPHPVPLPDISLETCLSGSRENMYNAIPMKSHPPPPGPPHHAHTGSSLSHDSRGPSVLGTSPQSTGTAGELAPAGSADTGISSRSYSLSQARAYSPRGSAQFFDGAGDASSSKDATTSSSASPTHAETLQERRLRSYRTPVAAAKAHGGGPGGGEAGNGPGKPDLVAQTMELDRMQSSLLEALETMRVESPPGVERPTITILPSKNNHAGVNATDASRQGGDHHRSSGSVRNRPLPKSPTDQSPFRRGTESADLASATPSPLAADSLQRGVAPITRDSLQLDNPNARRRAATGGSGGGGAVGLYEDVAGGKQASESPSPAPAPYETLSRIREEQQRQQLLRVDRPPGDARNDPLLISPPYAEASLIVGDMNPFAKLTVVSAADQHATVMEVFQDDTPDDVLSSSYDKLANDGDGYLDAEQPYDSGFIRTMSPSQSMQVRAPSPNSANPTAMSSQSPSSREWDGRETATPAALSSDSAGSAYRPMTPGGASLGSIDKGHRIGPSTGDHKATPLELWITAWISEYLRVDSRKLDVCHYLASDLNAGLVANTLGGGKGLALVHFFFDSQTVRQYKSKRKSILQALASGLNMKEIKVICREINHGQSLLMSIWLPEVVRDMTMRLAEEKSCVLLSAGIVMVRCLSHVVWCGDKKKQKKKKLRLSSKPKSKSEPVDFDKLSCGVDKTASELWLLMEPIEDPVHHAVLTGNHILVDTLISIGMDINQPTKEGETPLHLAAQLGHVDVARLLTDTGAIVDAPNSVNMTPLHWACNQGNAEVAVALIRAGAGVNMEEMKHKATPLHVAAVMGHPHIVLALVENGANLKATDNDGHTACHLAVLSAPIQMEDDNDVDDDYADILDILLCSGALPSPRSAEWVTPMHTAASQGQERLIQVLLHYHADVNAVDQRLWQTPLHFAAAAGKMGVVHLLANSGADLTAIDKDGFTAADIACNTMIREYLEERLTAVPLGLEGGGANNTGDVSEGEMLVTDV